MSGAPWTGRKLHFVGVGGAGMSGLALVAQRLGAAVSGSDRAESSYLARLRAAGISPGMGHDGRHVPAQAEVVYSTAVAEDNPELVAARAAGSPILHRADLLAELTRLRRTVAVSGAHGKTTTAAMLTHVLRALGRDPAYLIGGELRDGGGNAAWGAGEWLVVEADESDRSFLKLDREIAVVTNVELDHHATYPSLVALEDAFREFVRPAALRVVEADALPGLHATGPTVRFGIERGHLRAEGVTVGAGGSRFRVEDVAVRLRVPGRHNVLNALAALGALRAIGVDPAEAACALGSFVGAGRRFEPRGVTASGARVFDDYAHHPTEVRATLEAARAASPARLVACFQPHLYSRTRRLAGEFGAALALADVAVVVDVYPARERADDFPGGAGLGVGRAAAGAAADAARGRPVFWLPRLEDAERLLRERLRAGDVLLTLGAGDVDRVAAALVAPEGTATEPPAHSAPSPPNAPVVLAT